MGAGLCKAVRNWCSRNKHHELDDFQETESKSSDFNPSEAAAALDPEEIDALELDDVDSSSSDNRADSDESGKSAESWHHLIETSPSTPLVLPENNHFDPDSVRFKLNTNANVDYEKLNSVLMQRYVEVARTQGTYSVPLKTVIHDLELPSDATHLMVKLINAQGFKLQIPFDLSNEERLFPFESLAHVCPLDPDADMAAKIMLLHVVQGVLQAEDLTEKIVSFSWRLFHPGHSDFDPGAWSWLRSLSQDPEAVLLLTRPGRKGHTEHASLTLRDQKLVPWLFTDESP